MIWYIPSVPLIDQDAKLVASLLAVGDLFVSRTQDFKIYGQYCVWNYVAVRLLVTTRDENILALCRALETSSMHNGKLVGINSFMIKPVQRVLKYPLLLQNMVKEIKKDEYYGENGHLSR